MTSRKIALFFENYGLITEGIAVGLTTISAYFQFGAGLSSTVPINFLGVKVEPVHIANISLVVFVISLIIAGGGAFLWILTKNAPPLVDVDTYLVPTIGDELCISIYSNEPNNIRKVYVKILSLLDIKYEWEHAERMRINSTIEYDGNIVKEQKVKIIVMETRGENILVKTDDSYFIPIKYREVKKLEEKLNILMEVSIQLDGENGKRVVGIYKGIILHKLFKNFEDIDGIVNQNIVLWEPNSFTKINKKEFLTIKQSLVTKG